MNLDSWNNLSPESQKLIQDVVVEWEQKSFDDRQKDKVADEKVLQDGGMTFVPHGDEAGATYIKMSEDAAWARMSERMADDKETYEQLRKLYSGQ